MTVAILDIHTDEQPDNIGTFRNTTVVLEPDQPRDPRDIGRMTLSSAVPGVIDASWEAPGEAPANYRIMWAKTGEPFKTWTDLSGNAFPIEPAQTIAGLEEDKTYKVKVRASYDGTAGNWTGEAVITTSATVIQTGTNTPATVPGSPTSLGVLPNGSGTLDVSWRQAMKSRLQACHPSSCSGPHRPRFTHQLGRTAEWQRYP